MSALAADEGSGARQVRSGQDFDSANMEYVFHIFGALCLVVEVSGDVSSTKSMVEVRHLTRQHG